MPRPNLSYVVALWMVVVGTITSGQERNLDFRVPGETGAIEGVIYDPIGAPLPGLMLILEPNFKVDPRSTLPVGTMTTDAQGRYRFDELPPGSYSISAWIDFFPGITASIARGASVTRDAMLKISPVEQQFTVCAFCAVGAVPDSLRKEFTDDALASLEHPVSAPHPAIGWESYLPGLGLYPAAALEQELEGTVIVTGTVGVDGVPTAMQVVSASHPALGRAAVETLSAEFWEPGRIRGVAFEVPFRFLIRYVLRPEP